MEAVSLRKVDGGIMAATKFSGKPTEELVRKKEKELQSALLKDGLEPQQGCLLARYNDPQQTWSCIMVWFLFSSLRFSLCIEQEIIWTLLWS